ncbi:MAG: methylenetetrahydrofolate reductase [Candidatus Omnitrophica bacterium]|nr:methylenetetrahydrofolate reductase [Candidatus Omnitrophota bacterium]MDD5310716.1 methylenetetrahydrofolate reductase [Candidatus Omnitrophota bacterium]MDD5545600.1 methylenetetrahydrofolate reductase [Candidatus Omnitrophota bacterium]
MTLKEKIKNKKFMITSEIGPPKGTDVKTILEEARLLKGRVDAVNVTDSQSAVMRLGSLAVSRLLKEEGVEPVYQLTCRDRNRIALQSDALSAAVLGIENILVLTGDHPSRGDHPEAKPVFDLDSVQLIETLKKLESGKDLSGKELKGAPKFCIGAVVNPGADPVEPELIKFEKKLKAGAEFFQTQGVYDVKAFAKFIDKVKQYNTCIIAGIILIKSPDMARFMNKNVAGIFIPDSLINEVEGAADKQDKAVEIAARTIKELKGLAQGVHIMSLGWNRLVPRILDAAGL